MIKYFLFFYLIFFMVACTVYRISNISAKDQTILIGMKISEEYNLKNNIEFIEKAKNINIVSKQMSYENGLNILNYQILISVNKSIKLSDLISTNGLSHTKSNDSLGIYQANGKPLIVISNSGVINNFKKVLPWGILYQYIIRE